MMWSDKYNPTHLRDVIMDNNVRKKLNQFMATKNIPNLIVSGITGIGKSVLLECLAHDFYGKEYGTYVYKLNSSLEKNIKLLQETLEQFCKKKVADTQLKQKMFVIDDMDNIPPKIQNIIALIIEKYPRIYFTFTCNDSSNIIEMIQTRCIILYLHRPTKEQIMTHLTLICEREKCECTVEALDRICFLAQGDIRQAVNTLQTICDEFGKVTLKNIDIVCDIPSIVVLQRILDMCMKRETEKVLNDVSNLCSDGYSCSDILGGLFDLLKDPECKIQDTFKIPYMTIIGKSRYLVSKKVDSLIQLERCVIKMCQVDTS